MIPFNKPTIVGPEFEYIRQALAAGHLAGDGVFTKRCHAALESMTRSRKALLTHSGTAALELAALLLDISPGDEVIMPSFTFVSTANAFVLRGAVPVFVDVRDDTLNLDETLVEAAITERTRAIVVVHYAGVSCEMDTLLDIATRHGLMLIEDAAQGVGSSYRGRALGAIGALGALSFHETKNIISGEGGALLVNDETLTLRAEIIREKGTNRAAFFRGQVDKYTWMDLGSSYLPSEIIAAFLFAQLEHVQSLTARRMLAWRRYHDVFAAFEERGLVRRPTVPDSCEHNAHMYYLRLPDLDARQDFIMRLRALGVASVFHYVPLHSAPAGLRYGRAHGDLPVTDAAGDQLVRLPLWPGIEPYQDQVVDAVARVLSVRLTGALSIAS